MKIRDFLRKYALRGEGVRSLILLVLLFEAFAFISPTVSFIQKNKNDMAIVLPAVLGKLTNDERFINNIQSLKENELLTKAAQMKAEDMASGGYFAHVSPDGKNPWYWIRLAGYDYSYAGENLAVNFKNSEDVTKAWMNSPTHRDNIIRPVYTEVGTGVAKGVYKGRETDFIAQVYAKPAQNNTKISLGVVQGIGSEVSNLESRVLGASDIVDNQIKSEQVFVEKQDYSDEFLSIILAIVVALIVLGGSFAMLNSEHPVVTVNALAVLALVGLVFLVGIYGNRAPDIESTQMQYMASDEYKDYSEKW